ncbi:hypothetical protein [Streptosporangium sp. G12]
MSAFDTDPWATAAPAAAPPADEAQTAVQPTNTLPTTAPSKESTITVNNSSEAKVTTTIKYGSGFDAPWTVFHSNSVQEAEATLNEAKALLELTAKVAKFAKTLDSGTAPRPAASAGTAPSRPATSTPPGQQGKSCAHGEMTYRTGNGTKGPWAGYFCPLQKGDPDQCKAIFVRN